MLLLISSVILSLIAGVMLWKFKRGWRRKEPGECLIYALGFGTTFGALPPCTFLLRELYYQSVHSNNYTLLQMQVFGFLVFFALMFEFLKLYNRVIYSILGLLIGLSIPTITPVDRWLQEIVILPYYLIQ